MSLYLNIEVTALAHAIFSDYSHEEVRKLVEEICDCFADAALDEAIIADRLRSIENCYEESTMPSNEELLETYKELT